MDPFYFNAKLGDIIPLFDSHCHLQYPDYDHDRDEVIQNAKNVGLTHIICVGTDLEESKKALELAKKHPGYIYATVGNHPYQADKSIDRFEELITNNPNEIVAIGETGLDYFKSPIDHQIQKDSFKKHCELAVKFDLPVIIHLREIEDCYQDALQILKETNCKKAIFHSFSGNLIMAQEIWSLNYKTSFSLMLTYPKNTELREVYKQCPSHLKLHETDGPYLPPQNKRGLRNESGWIAELLII
jgi:TatD DNase family protein